MAIEIVSDKLEIKVSAKRLWKTFSEDDATFMTSALPEVIEKVVHEGHGLKPGSVRTIYFKKSFSEKKAKEYNVDHVILFTKEKVLEVDHDALFVKAEIIEGGFLGMLVKKYTNSIHLEDVGPDTCIIHWSFEYEPISEEHKAHIPHILKETFINGMHAGEAYLLSHNEY